MKVLVFCPNLIGDTVMATPAFRALRRGLVGGRGVNWKLDQAYLQPTRNCLIVT